MFSALSINKVQVYAFFFFFFPSEDFPQESSSMVEMLTELAYVRYVQGPGQVPKFVAMSVL